MFSFSRVATVIVLVIVLAVVWLVGVLFARAAKRREGRRPNWANP
jgi:hypothetical protein